MTRVLAKASIKSGETHIENGFSFAQKRANLKWKSVASIFVQTKKACESLGNSTWIPAYPGGVETR